MRSSRQSRPLSASDRAKCSSSNEMPHPASCRRVCSSRAGERKVSTATKCPPAFSAEESSAKNSGCSSRRPSMSSPIRNCCPLRLRDDVLHDGAVHVSQALVAALVEVREFLVVEAHQVKDGCV